MEDWWWYFILVKNNCWMKDNVTLFPLNNVASTLANLCVSDCICYQNIRLGMFHSWIRFLISKSSNNLLAHLYTLMCVKTVSFGRKKKNGEYLVRSTYRLCMHELLDTSHLILMCKASGTWFGIGIPRCHKN